MRLVVLRIVVLLSVAPGACRAPMASTDAGRPDAGTQADANNNQLRISTLNLRCLLEDWAFRLPLISAELAQLNPDVIALQEVCREEGGADALPQLIAQLEMLTGENYEFSRVETHLAWDQYQEGIALLTRHSFLQAETIELPMGVFPRKAVVGQIEARGISLLVAATHLSFGQQESVRVSQLDTIRVHLEGLRNPNSSLLIAGDLNEGPDGEAIQLATTAGYQDTWALLHPGDEGPTYPSENPRSRIDYILIDPNESVSAVSARRFLGEATGGRYASDHLGLQVDLGLEP